MRIDPMPALESLGQDIRYALRTYAKAPTFTAAAILTAALAIGANTTIFSLVNALLVRTLPVRDPGSLVRVDVLTGRGEETGLSYALFQELTARQRVFSAAMGWWGIAVMGVEIDGTFTQGAIWGATGNVHTDLGIRPRLGRLLTPADMSMTPPTTQRVAVLGHGFWHRQFQDDPGVVGRTVRIEGVPFTIVGVAPPGFTGFGIRAEPDVTIPLPAVALVNGRTVDSIVTRSSQWIQLVGRLRPGVTLEQARAQIGTLWPGIRSAATPTGFSADQRADFLSQGIVVASASRGDEPNLRTRFSRPLTIVFGIAGMILLIACANLASLLLSRTAARRHEIGVRLALGASRWRVSRQMITEGVLLAGAGGALGVLVAAWGSHTITSMIFQDSLVPITLETGPDATALVFTAAIAVLLGVLFSLAPVWRVARQRPSDAFAGSTRTVAGSRGTGRWLVSVQVALSLVLLVDAGLLVRSLYEIRTVASGMDEQNVMVAYPHGRPGAYAKVNNDVYYPELAGRIETIPGVQAVSISLLKPAGGGGGWTDRVAPVSEAVLARGIESTRTPVAPSFFKALGIPVVDGRDFQWADNSRAPKVAILSEHLARRLFGGRAGVGERIRVGNDPARQDVTVVGIVANARVYDLKNPNVDAVYMPALQDPDASYKCIIVRGAGGTFDELKRRVEGLGQEYVGNVQTLAHITDQALLDERVTTMLASFSGAFALVLAGVGLFGLMSYTVSERRREIGIRMALGAEPQRVVAGVVRGGLVVALTGAAVGLPAALAAARLLESMLFGVTTHDPVTLMAAPLCLIAIAVVASIGPATRAARVDPIIALKAE